MHRYWMLSGLWCQIFIILTVTCISHGKLQNPFSQFYPQEVLGVKTDGQDPGKPLFLTPYIQSGDIKTAQKLSQVGALNGTSIKSFSGFFTVDKKDNSNMFFWFFPAQVNPSEAPVLLWLQGGPGGSSLFGLFVENGPFGVDANGNLFPKKYSWNEKYSVLYIDNPVGTGFSFTDDEKGYANNETDVAVNLYSALSQFFTLFPDLQKNDFYITGESYAGKYIPAVSFYIMKHPGNVKLAGIAIGDGWTDPVTMIPAYADFMYEVGLLDENQRDVFRSKTNDALALMKQKQWVQAYKILNAAYDYSYDLAGTSFPYNYLINQAPADFQYYNKYLQKSSVRHAIHVGSLPYGSSADKVEHHLEADMLQSVAPWLAQVMNHYKVMIYSGQLDIIVGLPLTQAMLLTMPWDHLAEYKEANRTIWKVAPTDTEVAGYCRRVKNFFQVSVRNAGHILPYDQPRRASDMIDRFITGRGF